MRQKKEATKPNQLKSRRVCAKWKRRKPATCPSDEKGFEDHFGEFG
jgi:hypothetical protein